MVFGCFLPMLHSQNATASNALGSADLNTTNPPNLSWVVGEFEIIKAAYGEAIICPVVKGKLLPTKIEVKYTEECRRQYPFFEATQRLTLVIREGYVSQVYHN